MDLGWDDGTSGAYVNLGIPVHTGTNVASTRPKKVAAVSITALFQDGNTTLTAGVNTT